VARTPKEPVRIDAKQLGGIKRLRHLLPLLAGRPCDALARRLMPSFPEGRVALPAQLRSALPS